MINERDDFNMKKLINRFLGIVVAAALLVGTAMPNVAVMAAGSHAHHAGDAELAQPDEGYTITLKKPEGYNTPTSAQFGAYQIFTGTVKGDAIADNPGTETPSTAIPLTDIKWGNAFGDVNTPNWQNNIVNFVLELAKPPKTGDYASAFSNFNGFENFDNDSEPTELAERFYKNSPHNNNNNVNFDKLATEVAGVISQHNNHEWLQAFNDILGGYGNDYSGSGDHKGYVTQCYNKYNNKKGEWDNDEYKIKVPAGYYMVLDRSDVDTPDEAFSARMLFVANDITQTIKEDIPTLDKNILRDNGEYNTEVAGVGDIVEFQLTGTLPSNYDYYTLGYQYKFEDTFSKGLTLQLKNAGIADVYVTVTVKGVLNKATNEWNSDTTYTISQDSIQSDGTHPHTTANKAYIEEYNEPSSLAPAKLTVTFPCLKEIVIEDNAGTNYILGCNPNKTTERSEIYVTYKAMINENAIVSPSEGTTTNGNKNAATLEYSDNPQNYEDTETTTTSETEVYTFGLDIVKVDAAKFLTENGDKTKSALEDAKFAVVRKKATTSGADTEWEIAKFNFVEAGAADTNLPASFAENGYNTIGSWDTITDGVDPVKDESFDSTWIESYDSVEYNISTLTGGILNISGLDAGVEYTMVETATPDNTYAKIDPFTIKLTAATDPDHTDEYTGTLASADVSNTVGAGESFSYTHYVQLIDPNSSTSEADEDGTAGMLVANFKYVDLPSTGGIGIYPFYIVGGIVVAGSIILFALSRRKKTA